MLCPWVNKILSMLLLAIGHGDVDPVTFVTEIHNPILDIEFDALPPVYPTIPLVLFPPFETIPTATTTSTASAIATTTLTLSSQSEKSAAFADFITSAARGADDAELRDRAAALAEAVLDKEAEAYVKILVRLGPLVWRWERFVSLKYVPRGLLQDWVLPVLGAGCLVGLVIGIGEVAFWLLWLFRRLACWCACRFLRLCWGLVTSARLWLLKDTKAELQAVMQLLRQELMEEMKGKDGLLAEAGRQLELVRNEVGELKQDVSHRKAAFGDAMKKLKNVDDERKTLRSDAEKSKAAQDGETVALQKEYGKALAGKDAGLKSVNQNLAQANHEKARLQAKLDEKENIIKDKNEELQHKSDQLVELRDGAREADRNAESLGNEVHNLRIAQLTSAANSDKSQKDKASSERKEKALFLQIKNLTQEKADAILQHATREDARIKELATLKTDKVMLQHALKDSEKAYVDAQAQLGQANIERFVLRNVKEDLQIKNQVIVQERDSALLEQSSLSQRVKGLEKDNEGLSKDLKVAVGEKVEAVQQLGAIEGEHVQLRHEKNAAQEARVHACNEKESLSSLLDVVVEEKDDLAQNLGIIVAEKDDLAQNLGITVAKKDAVAQQLSVAVNQKDAATRQLSIALKDKDALAQELSVAVAENAATAQQLDVVVGEKAALVHDLGVAVNEKDAATQKLSNAINEKNTLARHFDIVVGEKDAVTQQLSVAVGEKVTLTHDFGVAVDEKNALMQQVNAADREKEDLHKKLDLSTSKYKALEEKFAAFKASQEKAAAVASTKDASVSTETKAEEEEVLSATPHVIFQTPMPPQDVASIPDSDSLEKELFEPTPASFKFAGSLPPTPIVSGLLTPSRPDPARQAPSLSSLTATRWANKEASIEKEDGASSSEEEAAATPNRKAPARSLADSRWACEVPAADDAGKNGVPKAGDYVDAPASIKHIFHQEEMKIVGGKTGSEAAASMYESKWARKTPLSAPQPDSCLETAACVDDTSTTANAPVVVDTAVEETSTVENAPLDVNDPAADNGRPLKQIFHQDQLGFTGGKSGTAEAAATMFESKWASEKAEPTPAPSANTESKTKPSSQGMNQSRYATPPALPPTPSAPATGAQAPNTSATAPQASKANSAGKTREEADADMKKSKWATQESSAIQSSAQSSALSRPSAPPPSARNGTGGLSYGGARAPGNALTGPRGGGIYRGFGLGPGRGRGHAWRP